MKASLKSGYPRSVAGLAALLLLGSAFAQDKPLDQCDPDLAPEPAAAAAAGATSAATASPVNGHTGAIEWLGQRFELQSHQARTDLDEAHYYPEKESPGAWSQRLVVQRTKTARQQTSAGLFINRLKGSLGPTARILGEGREAALLYCPSLPTGQGTDTCQMLCLALLQERENAGLSLIQYFQKDGALDQSQGELRLKAWRERFLQVLDRLNFPEQGARSAGKGLKTQENKE